MQGDTYLSSTGGLGPVAGRPERAAGGVRSADQRPDDLRLAREELIDASQKAGIISGHIGLAVTRRAAKLSKEAPPPKTVRGHHGDGRRRTPHPGLLPDCKRVGVGLLRLAKSPALGSGIATRLAD